MKLKHVITAIVVMVGAPIVMIALVVVVLMVNASRRADEDIVFNPLFFFSQASGAADYNGDYWYVESVVSVCKENEAKALKLYGGYGGFRGTVKKIGRDYIELDGGEGEFGTDCHVYVNDQWKLATLSKGDDIRFYGRFDGMRILHLIWRDATLKEESGYEFVDGE